MGTLTIRNLDDRVKQELRKRAAEHGVSMEEEARTILRDAVTTGDRSASSESMMGALDRLKAKYGAIELEIPPRGQTVREPPRFE
jgi:plasmid stability protein